MIKDILEKFKKFIEEDFLYWAHDRLHDVQERFIPWLEKKITYFELKEFRGKYLRNTFKRTSHDGKWLFDHVIIMHVLDSGIDEEGNYTYGEVFSYFENHEGKAKCDEIKLTKRHYNSHDHYDLETFERKHMTAEEYEKAKEEWKGYETIKELVARRKS